MTYRADPAVPSAVLVAQLLHEQAPALADESVVPSQRQGSSTWVFRVGRDHAVRLPRTDGYVADLLTEVRWLPRVAPGLPVAVPQVVVEGSPSDLFPRPWTVVTWVPGQHPAQLDPAQQDRLAMTLGQFVAELHAVDTVGLPVGARHWGYRCGEPVTEQVDGWAESAARGLTDLFDPGRVRLAWRRLRDVPPASSPPCWVHTDLSAENLLVDDTGALVGVIDFGGLGIGDGSVDLLYAWSLMDARAREVLRAQAHADEATWLRARAWAFVGPGLMTIESYRHAMPERTARLIAMVEAIAAEVGVTLR